MRVTEHTLKNLEKKVLQATGGYAKAVAMQSSNGAYVYGSKEYKTLEELKKSYPHLSFSIIEVSEEGIKRYSVFV